MIVLYRGDSTGGALGRNATIVITTSIDLTGCEVVFNFQSYVKRFNGVKSGEQLKLHFSHKDTQKMSLGVGKAVIYLVDSAGNVRTLMNAIPVKVTSSLAECYNLSGNQTDEIHISLENTIPFDRVTGVPKFIRTLWGAEPDEAGDVSPHVVKTVNGIYPDEKGNVVVPTGATSPEEIHMREAVGLQSATTEEINNAANIGNIVVPLMKILPDYSEGIDTRFADMYGRITRVRIFGAKSGYADTTAVKLELCTINDELDTYEPVAESKQFEPIFLNSWSAFDFDPVELPRYSASFECLGLRFKKADGTYFESARVGLVPCDPADGYSVGNSNFSKWFSQYKPCVEITFARNLQQAFDTLPKASQTVVQVGYRFAGVVSVLDGGVYAGANGMVFKASQSAADYTIRVTDSDDVIEFYTYGSRGHKTIVRSGWRFVIGSEEYQDSYVIGDYSYFCYQHIRLTKVSENTYLVEVI